MPSSRKYAYVVFLKNDRQRAGNLISLLLCFFSAAFFFYVGLQSLQLAGFFYIYLALATLIVLGTGRNILRVRRKKHPVRYRHLLMIAGGGWLFLPGLFWMAIPFVGLSILEPYVKQPLEIGFDPDCIVINSLIRQKLNWSAFSNILLKDGLLTLDYKDNRLLQWEVLDDEDGDADEEEFNAFCRGQLAKAGTRI
jgi:hypothetical protein